MAAKPLYAGSVANRKETRMASKAVTPVGLNHLVLNVRNLETSHKFWTEIMGFRQVAELRPKPGRPPMKMRFYSGVDEHGHVNHHDVALMEVPQEANGNGDAGSWSLAARQTVNRLWITPGRFRGATFSSKQLALMSASR